jgi:hypothetical protein
VYGQCKKYIKVIGKKDQIAYQRTSICHTNADIVRENQFDFLESYNLMITGNNPRQNTLPGTQEIVTGVQLSRL